MKNQTLKNMSLKKLFSLWGAVMLIAAVAQPAYTATSANASNGQEEGQALAPLESVDIADTHINNIEDSLAMAEAKALDEVKAYLNSIRSLKAEFSQQGAQGNIVKGVLHLERPGKVRFEYEGDIPLLIVGDGTIINMIDYDIGQITKWPINDTPLALLLANEVQFNSHTTISSQQHEMGVGLLSVTAREPENPQQGSLTLILSKDQNANLELIAWQVVDAQGKLTTVSIRNMEMNQELSSDLWAFEDPRGNRRTRNRRR